ncbi:MAG: hypothetical protein ABIF85_07330 [Nanoarchaeota archaeon]|nr:hypothetical protein [Nanoarchaeota archaeon]MBU4299693.1 hypothetical protein [Nanoarchaeota archaeon]MBU4451207.1 hypothetical protein [Nanoarchaeota archaeon]MCG2723305.1 hypothetical protein [archaeon]
MLELNKYKKSISQLKNKRWVLLSVCFAAIFIILGHQSIESYYAPTFPVEINAYNISQDKYLRINLFSCNSNKIYPVVGEDLKCCAYVEDLYKKDFKENIPTYIYFGDHNFDENYTESFKPLALGATIRRISENNQLDCANIRIRNYGRNTYTFGLIYHNAEYDEKRTIFTNEVTFFAYDISEYDNKLNQKLSLYFILFSLGIFSMFSFVKTLLDIIRDR